MIDILQKSVITIMLNGHVDPNFLHKYAKTLSTVISTPHVIVMSVPITNMSLKCHIHLSPDILISSISSFCLY